jgi:hypothetical protein
VAVGEDDSAEVLGAQSELSEYGTDLGKAPSTPGVDQGRALVVDPEVGLADGEPQAVQVGSELLQGRHGRLVSWWRD